MTTRMLMIMITTMVTMLMMVMMATTTQPKCRPYNVTTIARAHQQRTMCLNGLTTNRSNTIVCDDGLVAVTTNASAQKETLASLSGVAAQPPKHNSLCRLRSGSKGASANPSNTPLGLQRFGRKPLNNVIGFGLRCGSG